MSNIFEITKRSTDLPRPSYERVDLDKVRSIGASLSEHDPDEVTLWFLDADGEIILELEGTDGPTVVERQEDE